MSESTASLADEASASSAPAASSPQKPSAPFSLAPGAEIRRGVEVGRVTEVRGNGEVPYEARIRWKSARHPEWELYQTLARQYDEGELEILKRGRESLLRRLCPFC